MKPDDLEAAYAAVHETLTATRAFPGCLGVEVLIDNADPAHVVLLERWESPEADAAYRAWRATPEGVSSLGPMVTAAPVLTVLQDSDL